MLNLGISRKRNATTLAFIPPPGNVILNWAGTGTTGTSGLPDTWKFSAPSGLALTVLSRTPYRGGNIIDFQIAGTPAASSACALYLGAVYNGGQSAGAAAPGQVWSASAFVEAVGTPTPGPIDLRMRFKDAAGTTLSPDTVIAVSGSIASGPTNGPNVVAPATTDSVGALLYKTTITAGTAVSLRYRVFAPTLARVS